MITRASFTNHQSLKPFIDRWPSLWPWTPTPNCNPIVFNDPL
jgi:hypothetical protein